MPRHREHEAKPVEPELGAKEGQRLERLERDAAQIRRGLTEHPEERRGAKGSIRKSNRPDNDRAKMATRRGVIQGYPGVAAVDGTPQLLVETQAPGTGAEPELRVPVVVAMKDVLTDPTGIIADAGSHREETLPQLATMKMEALIADNVLRQRDERFSTQARHKAAPDPLHDQSSRKKKVAIYQPSDVTYEADARTCVGPAGKWVSGNGRDCCTKRLRATRFRRAARDCVPCSLPPHTTKAQDAAGGVLPWQGGECSRELSRSWRIMATRSSHGERGRP